MYPAVNPDRPAEPILIGRKEFIDFPAWPLLRVRAKIDTGAYSSVLDVGAHELIETPEGLRLRLKPRRGRFTVEEAVVGFITVSSSCGVSERRPLLEPLIRLGPIARRIRLTVTDRSPMRYRMLLGRQALADFFLVDPSRKDLLPQATPEQHKATGS